MRSISNILKALRYRYRCWREYCRPQNLITIDQLIRRRQGHWHPVFPAINEDWPNRARLQEISPILAQRLRSGMSELGVLEISDARVVGLDGWVYDLNDQLVVDLSWFRTNYGAMRVPRQIGRVEKLDGVTVSMTTTWGHLSYYHYLIESLCRWELLRQVISTGDVDHVICHRPPSAHAQRVFELLRLDPGKLRFTTKGVTYQTEHLFAGGFPGYPDHVPAFTSPFLRKLVGLDATTWAAGEAEHRLYVSRKGYRRLATNEAELQQLLKQYDFEVYDPGEHPNQAEDFNNASMIVAAHGAALTNIAFCRPGTRLLELIPSDQQYVHYYTMSESASIDYHCVICPSTAHRRRNDMFPSPYDFHVGLNLVQDCLRSWVEGGYRA